MRPYLIERLLSPLAPALALRRARARLELEAMTRAYEAAKPSRATKNWHTTSSSAAAEDGLSLKALRNRSRALVRDLGLTDLSLFTEARYTRHPTQADRHAPFQDHPAALEHFPTGSLMPPVQAP